MTAWTGQIHGFDLIASPTPNDQGDRVFYAEVVAAGSRWLPWPGRTARWWFEVHAVHATGEHVTYAYIEGGSGGGFTLRSCVARAMQAVDRFGLKRITDGGRS